MIGKNEYVKRLNICFLLILLNNVKYVFSVRYHDTNLDYSLITGRSFTLVLKVFKKTPTWWCSKKKAKVDTTTYGSEYLSDCTCTEKIIDLRINLKYLGFPLIKKSCILGDNKYFVDSSVTTCGRIHKRHEVLSFHWVKETIASGIISTVSFRIH